MKHLLPALIIVLLWSCGGSKTIGKNQADKAKPKVTATPKTPEVTALPQITDFESKTPSGQPKAKALVDSSAIKKDNTLEFHQNLTKHEGYIHDPFNELLKKHVSENGNVDYKNFKSSYKGLLGYIRILQMAYSKLDAFSRDEQLAYWINAYNALTIDLILRNYPVKSIKDIDKPWDQRLWQFGDKWLNLNDIEHQILRKMDEPRIHFAIVCASESCPKLQNFAFTANELEKQLTLSTKEFLADTSKNEISENSIKLSKIFKWFAKDFKANGRLIDFLNQYSDIKILPQARKTFKDYDWSLNE